jgi:hypothetical protein
MNNTFKEALLFINMLIMAEKLLLELEQDICRSLFTSVAEKNGIVSGIYLRIEATLNELVDQIKKIL